MSKANLAAAIEAIPETNPDEPKTLDAAIVAVMKHCPYIKKTGRMSGGGANYTFASETDVIASLHEWLVRFGLTFTPTEVKLLYQEQYPSKSGNLQNRVGLVVRYRMAHALSGQVTYCESAGEGCDSGDKAASKAMTCALKYALRQTFNIETGDQEADPDNTASAQQQRAPVLSDGATKARDAMARASTSQTLEKFWGVAQKRGYKPHELETIRGAYLAAKAAFSDVARMAKAATSGRTDTDSGNAG